MTEAPIDHALADLAERVAFLFPGYDERIDDIEDEGSRLLPIEAEHPRGEDQPEDAWRMHTSLHLVVANQVLGNNPPEVWPALQRIVAKGYTRHDALHMVAAGMSEVLYHAMRGQPQAPEVYERYLEGLPKHSVRNAPAPTSRTGGGPNARRRKRR